MAEILQWDCSNFVFLSGGDHGFIDDVTWLSFYGATGDVPGVLPPPSVQE